MGLSAIATVTNVVLFFTPAVIHIAIAHLAAERLNNLKGMVLLSFSTRQIKQTST